MSKYIAGLFVALGSILSLVFPIGTAFAADFTITGAGSTAVNGDYNSVGANEWQMVGGGPRVKAYPGYNQCWVQSDSGSPLYYYTNDVNDCNDLSSLQAVGTWLLDAGVNPGPDFGGGGGGSSGSDNVATSSIDQIQRNTNNAYWVFFGTMVFVIWLFKRKS